MKKSIFLMFFILTLFSCKQENKINVSVIQDDRIGILHNQILDTVSKDLWKEKINAFTSDKSEKLVTSGNREVLLNNRIDLAYNSLKRGFNNLLPDVNTNVYIDANMSKDKFTSIVKQGKTLLTRSINNSPNTDTQNLTPFQQEYYAKLMQSINSKNVSLETVLLQISDIEKVVVQNSPTPEEAEQFLLYTSIARYSAQYWTENINKWIALNSEIIGVLDNLKRVETKGPPETGILTFDNAFPPGYYPYPGYPEYYIYVPEDEPGIAVVLACPAGLYYDPLRCICNWPDVIDNPDDTGSSFWSNLVGSDIGGAIGGGFFGLPSALASGSGASVGIALGGLFDWLF
jgi:hypothetical protein